LHLYTACVHYIRTHPYRASLDREAENQQRNRQLDVVDDVVDDDDVVVVVAADVDVVVVAAATTFTTTANTDVENRKKR